MNRFRYIRVKDTGMVPPSGGDALTKPYRFYAAELRPNGLSTVETSEFIKPTFFGNKIAQFEKACDAFLESIVRQGWTPIPSARMYMTERQVEGSDDQECEYCLLSRDGITGQHVANLLTPKQMILISSADSEQDLRKRLADDGWKPIGSDDEHMFRSVIASAQANTSEGGTASDVLDTVKKLAELRDAGAITEQEYEEKKNKLLERL